MHQLKVNGFYYFGKLCFDNEFIGSAPGVVKELLDRWAIELNKTNYSMPLWKEAVLFNVPGKNYRYFYSGIFWNSADGKNRKYPFALYWKVESQEASHFLVASFNKDSFTEVVQNQWQFLCNVDFNNVKAILARDGRIARFIGNVLQTVDLPEAIVSLEPDEEGKHLKLFSSVKKEWIKEMGKFPIAELSDDRLRLHLTTAKPPWYLAFVGDSEFHKFIEKNLCQAV